MLKIVLISNSSTSCFYFRHDLSIELVKRGYEILEIVGDSLFCRQIENWGVRVVVAKLETRNKNPLKLFEYQARLRKILRKEKPDIVFSFQTKPNIFGLLSSKKLKINKRFAMVEGLGDGFGGSGFRGWLLSNSLLFLYKQAMKNANNVFFLNVEDQNYFIHKRIVKPQQIVLIHGIGIDCQVYRQLPFDNFRTATMISRLIPKKGVFDFCEAARICKKNRPDLTFRLIGIPVEITQNDLLPYIEDGSIEFLGRKDYLESEYEKMTVSVVPTYYLEGLPKSILEAMASGRPVITTNTRGCNFCIDNGKNGLFVNPKDPKDLAEKLLWLFSHEEKIKEMGENARKFAVQYLDSSIINQSIIDVMFNRKSE